MNLTPWEQKFINLAKFKASWSKDPNTKIGAIIVHDESRQDVSSGYNGLARGVEEHHLERHSRESGEKYFWYAHAEANAVFNAARHGIRTLGATIYLSCGSPCCACSIAIIQAGIKKIICQASETGSEKWVEDCRRGRIMLREAGVEIKYYTGE